MPFFSAVHQFIAFIHQSVLQPTPLSVGGRIAIIVGGAYLINRLGDTLISFLGRRSSSLTDNARSRDQVLRRRRLETYLSISTAAFRVLVIAVALSALWQLLAPASVKGPLALIGVGTVFLVFANATVSPLLKDITYGVIMLLERWYNVGDHIEAEPFNDLSGVVEQVTLRSTKLRNLNGEAIWIHNQHMQAVRVTARGLRTMAIEIFVNDLEQGRRLVESTIRTLPTGPTMLTQPPGITDTEALGDGLWRITAVGETPPGREWLIQNFAVAALTEADNRNPNGPVIVHGPIVRSADSVAERRFRRTVRAQSKNR